MKILEINSLEILDSRGNPTLQVDVMLDDGSKGRFCVPSGASTGTHEACELRDGNKNLYGGKSVQKAVQNVRFMAEQLIDTDFTQQELDMKLIDIDGTENKSNMGANAILGISIAFAKASAMHYNLPLHEYLRRMAKNVSFTNKLIPNPEGIHLFANIINGGLHSGNALNIQEFMVVPLFGSVNDKIRAISEIYQVLKSQIAEKYGKMNTGVGDEGGFAPDITEAREALDLIMGAVDAANYVGKVGIAIDAAASDFYNSTTKKYEVEKDIHFDFKELTDYYNNLIRDYPIISIEDPMSEDDFEGFSYFVSKIERSKIKNSIIGKDQVIVVGDDLLVTNPVRIEMAIEKKLCTSLLLKINQIGTLTESIDAYRKASSANWHTIVSHRSGETSDDFISDLAVALNSSIKIGAPARGERVSKYNKLLNIFK